MSTIDVLCLFAVAILSYYVLMPFIKHSDWYARWKHRNKRFRDFENPWAAITQVGMLDPWYVHRVINRSFDLEAGATCLDRDSRKIRNYLVERYSLADEVWFKYLNSSEPDLDRIEELAYWHGL